MSFTVIFKRNNNPAIFEEQVQAESKRWAQLDYERKYPGRAIINILEGNIGNKNQKAAQVEG